MNNHFYTDFIQSPNRCMINRLLKLSFTFLLMLQVQACSDGHDQSQAEVIADTERLIKPAQRIVALSPHSVEMLYAIGVGDRILGTTDHADYPEEAKKIARIGGFNGIQLEALVALEPDLVVAWEGGNKAEDLNKIEELGINLFRSSTKRLLDIPREVRKLGQLTGSEDQANQLAKQFEDRYIKLKQGSQDKSKIPFFYQLWSEPLRTLTDDTWISEMISGCGGINVIEHSGIHYPEVNVEHLLKVPPRAILIPVHSEELTEKSQSIVSVHKISLAEASNRWQIWRDWSEIPAVKDENFILLNGDLMHRFSLRALDGMASVCEAFDQIRKNSTKK